MLRDRLLGKDSADARGVTATVGGWILAAQVTPNPRCLQSSFPITESLLVIDGL